jgi:hypothetical protein
MMQSELEIRFHRDVCKDIHRPQPLLLTIGQTSLWIEGVRVGLRMIVAAVVDLAVLLLLHQLGLLETKIEVV